MKRTKKMPGKIRILGAAAVMLFALAALSGRMGTAGAGSPAVYAMADEAETESEFEPFIRIDRDDPESPAQSTSAAGTGSESPASDEQEEEPVKDFDSDDYYTRLLGCVDQIRARSDFEPDVALVLGSGLGNYAKQLNIVTTIPYDEINGWPTTSVAGHSGNLIFATMDGLNIAVMQGRVHYYEGYDMQDVVLPLRVLHLLGAKTVVLTNAVGAINEDFAVGDFVVVEDHISLFVPSPLIGENIDELGKRFTGMTSAYDKELRDAVLQIGEDEVSTRGTVMKGLPHLMRQPLHLAFSVFNTLFRARSYCSIFPYSSSQCRE